MKSKISRKALAAVGAVMAAALVVLPASMASAVVQGGAVSVVCPSGSGTCTRYGANFNIPNSNGTFTIYYTVQWSSSGGSYKVVQVRWINNTTKDVYFGGYGIHSLEYGYAALGLGTSATSYRVASAGSYTFNESQFNGSGKGLFVPKSEGAYGISQDNVSSWQYHNSSLVPTSGAMYLG